MHAQQESPAGRTDVDVNYDLVKGMDAKESQWERNSFQQLPSNLDLAAQSPW